MYLWHTPLCSVSQPQGHHTQSNLPLTDVLHLGCSLPLSVWKRMLSVQTVKINTDDMKESQRQVKNCMHVCVYSLQYYLTCNVAAVHVSNHSLSRGSYNSTMFTLMWEAVAFAYRVHVFFSSILKSFSSEGE